jgi:hypothetical protein
MKIRLLMLAMLVALPAYAQRADCPRVDAPRPMSPAGGPPPFRPSINPPAHFGDPMPPPKSGEIPLSSLDEKEKAQYLAELARRRANDDLLNAEEGHVAGLAWEAQAARSDVPRGVDPTKLADIRATPLQDWAALGYGPNFSPHNVTRYFRAADGSVVSLHEWDYKADGGAVFALPGSNNLRVRGFDARMGGLRSPSGCVNASLAWTEPDRSVDLLVVGPRDLARQRALLRAIAETIAWH